MTPPADPSAPRLCQCGHANGWHKNTTGYCQYAFCGCLALATPTPPVDRGELPTCGICGQRNTSPIHNPSAPNSHTFRAVDRGGEDIGALVDALEAVCTGGGRNAAGGEWLHDIQAARAARTPAPSTETSDRAVSEQEQG
jgi:hypothetical protein